MTEEQPFTVDLNEGYVRISGELVAGSEAANYIQAVRRLAASRGASGLRVDLTDVTFIDSVGVRELLKLRRDLPDMRVAALSERVHQRLRLTGTEQIILRTND